MSDDKKPRVVLDVPSNLKPEDLARILPGNGPTPEKYNFLGSEVTFFENDTYAGFEIKWGAEGIGWGSVTLSMCLQDNPRGDGTFWARKGDWGFDDECMSEEFVAALLKHVSLDLAKAMFKLQEKK